MVQGKASRMSKLRYLVAGLAVSLSACGPTRVEPVVMDSSLPISSPPVSKCINIGSALEAPNEGEWGYTVRQGDLLRIKQAGFDTIRLPVKWSAHTRLDAPYQIEPSFLARVDEILSWAEQVDLKVILNVHHYDELNEDPETHIPRLEAIWDALAAHYAGAPDSLMLETINEPHSNMTIELTDPLNKRVLERIRQDHPDRWVILGTASWGSLDALAQSRPDYDPKVMLTYHEYSPYDFTHQGAPWADAPATGIRWGTRRDVREMMDELDKAVAIRERLRMPILVGEFGVYEEVPVEHRARWTRTLRQGFEARDLAWCYWDFAGSLKAYDIDREAWLPEIKSALLDE